MTKHHSTTEFNMFLGHSIRWWSDVLRVLRLFNVRDGDHLAYMLRSRGNKAEVEGSDGLEERIAELETALRPFVESAKTLMRDDRTDEEVAALVSGADLTPSDFWFAAYVLLADE